MIKRLLLILSVILLCGVGYFAYVTWKEAENLSVWSFIPENSLLIVENEGINQLINHLGNQQTWNTLALIPEVAAIDASVQRMDSLLNQQNGFANALNQTPLLFSLHRTGKNRMAFLMVAEVSNLSNRNLLTNIQDGYLKAGYRKKNRVYLDQSIVELTGKKGESFTYTLYKNYFIGSFEAFLVEDAIRTLNSEPLVSFGSTSPELFDLIKLQKDQGNLYINLQELKRAITDISPKDAPDQLGKSAFLDLRIENEQIELDGFAFAENEQWLKILDGINGQSFDISEVVPNKASILYHFSFDDPMKWGKNYSSYLKKNHPEYYAGRARLQTKLDVDVSYLYQILSNEVAVCAVFDADQTHKTLIMEMKDMSLAQKYFDGINERFFNQTKDSIYQEDYKDYLITAFIAEELPLTLMGPIGEGFENCFYTSHRNYFLMSNTLPGLKQIIDDLEEENTWKKSLRKNNFLSKTNQEASFSMYINLPASISHLSKRLHPNWQPLIKDNEYILRSFENIAIQFNQVDDKYFTNILIDQEGATSIGEMTPTVLKSIALGAKLITKPILVKDHTTTIPAVFVQDSTFTLYWVNDAFEVNWTLELDGPLQGGIQTLDYYKNSKLQYAFITPGNLHLVDREGKYIAGFPKNIGKADSLRSFNIIDYNSTKDYRFAIADRKGSIFLTDKEGNPLDGWDPKKMDRPLVQAPTHYRIGGKDLFAISMQKGEIHILNRRGDNYKGFPYSLEDFLTSPPFIRSGSSLEKSSISFVTQNGTYQTIDLTGKTQSIAQLYKPDPETVFKLILDVSNSSYLIGRFTDNQLDLLNADQELLFSKDYLSREDLFVQYYSFSPARQYIVVGNRSGTFIYLYDMTGRLMMNRPLQGNQPVSMMYYEKRDEQHIYLINDEELTLYLLGN